MKYPVVENINYILYLERFQNNYFNHCDVKHWNKRIKKEYLEDLKRLISVLPSPLYALIGKDNKKLIKFAQLSGMKKHQEIVGTDNKPYLIFVRGN